MADHDEATGVCEANAPGADRGLAAEATAVTAFWRQLGLPGLVDVHTHFMPPNGLAKVWAFFDGVGCGEPGRSWPIVYRLPEQERLSVLRAFGVRRFTALLYPHKPDMAVWLNAWAADFAASTPDALHSATFYPEAAAPDYVSAAIEAGARLFKAHVQVGRYDPRDQLLDPVWGSSPSQGCQPSCTAAQDRRQETSRGPARSQRYWPVIRGWC